MQSKQLAQQEWLTRIPVSKIQITIVRRSRITWLFPTVCFFTATQVYKCVMTEGTVVFLWAGCLCACADLCCSSGWCRGVRVSRCLGFLRPLDLDSPWRSRLMWQHVRRKQRARASCDWSLSSVCLLACAAETFSFFFFLAETSSYQKNPKKTAWDHFSKMISASGHDSGVTRQYISKKRCRFPILTL